MKQGQARVFGDLSVVFSTCERKEPRNMLAAATEFGLAGLYQYIGYDIGTGIEKSPIPIGIFGTGHPIMEREPFAYLTSVS